MPAILAASSSLFLGSPPTLTMVLTSPSLG
uniref:Uncharacterized protein n=1 Tax=Arundo donax TaxID=35708 RepID=A0A0A9E469_ARUDO